MLIEQNEVRWLPGQEASLAPPCSNLRSFGRKWAVRKKVLMWPCWDFLTLPQWFDARKLFPLPSPCSTPARRRKHKIDNKTRHKHRYNTIPIFRSIFFPRNYTVVHLCFINTSKNVRETVKFLQYSLHPA